MLYPAGWCSNRRSGQICDSGQGEGWSGVGGGEEEDWEVGKEGDCEEDKGGEAGVEEAEGEDEEDIDIFDTFKFTSFRTNNAINERYDMVHLKDPEEPEPIETQMIFPKDKVDKNSVELVSINADALAK